MASYLDFHDDPRPKDPFARGAGPYQPEPTPRGHRAEPGRRVWDRSTCSWYLEPREVDWGTSGGQQWQVLDTRTGVVLWTYGAGSFGLALIEKRRLCQEMGWKSGWGYLLEV